jgi:acyl-CoA thioester hydrolase
VRFPLEIRYPDYDAKGHINNAIYLTYFEIARARAWTGPLGGAETDIPFIVAEASVRYVSEARIGDPLDIEMRTTEIRTKAWVWSYRVIDRRDERLVAEGRTVQVMYDYDARATGPIPDTMRSRLESV